MCDQEGSDTDDDIPTLSAEAFLALNEFYAEKERNIAGNIDNNVTFDEDWQLSQFWYDESTVNILSNEIKRIAGDCGKVALISCPTLYKQVKRLCNHGEVCLFEYDKRFAAYGEDYHYYDYKSPLDIPRDFAQYFDVVVADPPFLSQECITNTAVTIKFLANDKIILCTGTIMEELVERLLKLKITSFKPQHKNNLANDFSCYTNYEHKFDM